MNLLKLILFHLVNLFGIKQFIKNSWDWIKRNTKKVLITLGIVGVATAAGISQIQINQTAISCSCLRALPQTYHLRALDYQPPHHLFGLLQHWVDHFLCARALIEVTAFTVARGAETPNVQVATRAQPDTALQISNCRREDGRAQCLAI